MPVAENMEGRGEARVNESTQTSTWLLDELLTSHEKSAEEAKRRKRERSQWRSKLIESTVSVTMRRKRERSKLIESTVSVTMRRKREREK